MARRIKLVTCGEFHVEVCDKSRDLMRAKNADYADSYQPFGNLDVVESIYRGQITTEQGIVIRMGEKVARLATATQRPLEVQDESVVDTCCDIINYAILLLAKQTTRGSQP